MDAAAALLSPRSCPSSPFSFSPLPSPSSSSCGGSPSHSAAAAFSFSPRPIAAASPPRRAGFPDLDSGSSSFWGPRSAAIPLQEPPLFRHLRPSSAVDVSSYATTDEPPAAQYPLQAPPPRTHYDLLGVSPTSPLLEIRSAYRKLALQHHPDVSPLHQLDRATKFFAQINEAYTVLSDPQKKACYDLKLALESQAQAQSMVPASPVSQMRYEGAASPRKYTDSSTGRVYPSMNSFYREWRRAHA